MYRLAQRTLTEAGYEHYEISNYARPGYQCRHNRVYWENRPYYGFGMGAASYTQQQRFNRPRTRRQYSAWLDTYIAQAGRLDCPATPPGEQLLDQIMVGLRLSEGIPTEPIRHTLGNPALAHLKISLQPYLTAGTVILEDKRLRLSDPDGFLISNTILAEIFHLLGNAGAAG
jgi:oxygen-independent coproporphyrinogen-3 oxidase